MANAQTSSPWTIADSLSKQGKYHQVAIIIDSIAHQTNSDFHHYQAALFYAASNMEQETINSVLNSLDNGFDNPYLIDQNNRFEKFRNHPEWTMINTKLQSIRNNALIQFRNKYIGKIALSESTIKIYSHHPDSLYYQCIHFNDYRPFYETIYPKYYNHYFEDEDVLLPTGNTLVLKQNLKDTLIHQSFQHQQTEYYFIDSTRYLCRTKVINSQDYTTIHLWRRINTPSGEIALLMDKDIDHRTTLNGIIYTRFDQQLMFYSNRSNDTIHLSSNQSIVLENLTIPVCHRFDILKDHYNDKVGVKTHFGEIIIPTHFDSILTHDLIAAFKANKVTLFDYWGNIIVDSLKAFVIYGYLNKTAWYQIIDKNNHLLFINSLGHTTPTPPFQISTMGNDSDQASYTKLTFHKKHKERYIIEEVYHSNQPHNPPWSENPNPIINFHLLLRQYQEIRFVNNTPSIFHENYWYDVGRFKKLDYRMMIVKYKRRYGIVSYPDEEIIIPFVYDLITGCNTHLILESKGLKTYYPYDLNNQYTELADFIHYFARFKLLNNRYGWIDRAGNQYHDNPNY